MIYSLENRHPITPQRIGAGASGMLKTWVLGIGALLTLCAVSAAAPGDVAVDASATPSVPTTAPTTEPIPYLLKSEGHQFTLLKNWTFVNDRPDATVHNKRELNQDFYYLYTRQTGTLAN